MAAILTGLTIRHSNIHTDADGNKTQLSRPFVQPQMAVTPDGDPEAQKLGFLQVTVEAHDIRTGVVPELPPEQMKQWVVDLLKRVM